jgi:hypothetical protein
MYSHSLLRKEIGVMSFEHCALWGARKEESRVFEVRTILNSRTQAIALSCSFLFAQKQNICTRTVQFQIMPNKMEALKKNESGNERSIYTPMCDACDVHNLWLPFKAFGCWFWEGRQDRRDGAEIMELGDQVFGCSAKARQTKHIHLDAQIWRFRNHANRGTAFREHKSVVGWFFERL